MLVRWPSPDITLCVIASHPCSLPNSCPQEKWMDYILLDLWLLEVSLSPSA